MRSKLSLKNLLAAGTVLAATSAMLIATSVSAADHLDAPQVSDDPAADINDTYVFMNPNDAGEVIIANTVFPLAGPGTRFSDAVAYNTIIRNDAGDDFVISCTFDGGVSVTCGGPDGLMASGPVGNTITNGDIRIFAGLRDDPFFFDLMAFNATADTGMAQFTDPGDPFFQGLDTLSIVMGINADALTNNGANPTLEVYSVTARSEAREASGVQSGFFENQNEAGQGIFLEVIAGANGSVLGVGWLTFTPNGDQLYLTGAGQFNGRSATVNLLRTDNGTFPSMASSGPVAATSAGSLELDLDNGCDLVTGTFVSNDADLPSTDVVFNRLTGLQGLPCNDFANGQVDRMGRPAINTALIDLLGNQPGAEDQYNQAADRSSWPARFQSIIQGNIEILDTLDGETGNTLLPPADLAGVLVDDVLLINTSIADCGAYLAVELGVTDQCGGRVLSADVIDASLGALVGPGASDFVDNNSTFLTEFPFVGVPNSMTGTMQQ